MKNLNDLDFAASANSQRKRILAYFSNCPKLTVAEARDFLGVFHAPSRILELRRQGWKIKTVWTCEIDKFGTSHRVGLYIFEGKNEGSN